MASILRWAVRTRLLVLAVALGVCWVGVLQLRDAPVDVLPEFSPAYAEVQTEALGLSAEEVEQLITVPLEADLLNGVEGVEVIRSKSLPGLSSIVMVFEPGRDVYRERQLIEERLTQAHALPHVSKPPTLLQPLSSSSRVLMIGLSSEELSGIEQSVLAQWVLRPKLVGVPGVANVAVWGMRDQQLQVQVDPERLRQQGVTLSQVVESAGNAQVVSPLTFLEASTPGTGGFIETPQQRLQVRHLIEKIADPAALGGVPIAGTGGRLRISDVADVTVDHQPLIGDAVVEGGPGLMLVVEKFPGADTRRGQRRRAGCPRDVATWTDRDSDGQRGLPPRRLRRRSTGQPCSRAARRRCADAAGSGGMPVAVAVARRRAGCACRCPCWSPRWCSTCSGRASTRSCSPVSPPPSPSWSTKRWSRPTG